MAKVVVLASFAQSLTNFRAPLLRLMVEQGHEVHACAPPDDAIEAALAGMQVRFTAIGPARKGLNPLADVGYLLRLVAFLRESGSDVVMAYTAKPVIWGSFAARLARVPRPYVMITGLGFAFGVGTSRSAVAALTRVLYAMALRCCHGYISESGRSARAVETRNHSGGCAHYRGRWLRRRSAAFRGDATAGSEHVLADCPPTGGERRP